MMIPKVGDLVKFVKDPSAKPFAVVAKLRMGKLGSVPTVDLMLRKNVFAKRVSVKRIRGLNQHESQQVIANGQ